MTTLTPELLDRLIYAVYQQQRDTTGREWDALQHTLNRLDELESACNLRNVTDGDATWALGVARLYGLVSDTEVAP